MAYSLCSTVSWSAVERVKNNKALQLYHDEQVIWNRNDDAKARIPSILPFQFELTDDLPQCSHVPGCQLTYQIMAHLHHTQGRDLHAEAPFHPRRYIMSGWNSLLVHANSGQGHAASRNSGEVEYSLDPVQWKMNTVAPAYFWLNRTIIRHVDPLRLQAHIPPPSELLVVEKGLQLQSVSAHLTRIIQSHPQGRVYSDEKLLQYLSDAEPTEISRVTSQSQLDEDAVHPYLRQYHVAYTGKSCRFHSKRPIHLCFALFPGSILGSALAVGESFNLLATNHELGGDMICESITQDTALQNVRFVLTIRVVIKNEKGDHRDIVTRKLIKILPSPAGTNSTQNTSNQVHGEPEKPYSTASGESLPQQVSDAFAHPNEYDGYDDSIQDGNSMRAMTLTNPVAFNQLSRNTSTVEVCETPSLEPPPNILEHVKDTHVPDYVQFTPALSSMQHESRCITGVNSSEDDEELPNFDEASQQPQAPLAMALQTWPVREEDYATPPLTNEPDFSLPANLMPEDMRENDLRNLPPSYMDSTYSTPPRAMSHPCSPTQSEPLPPAYAPQSSFPSQSDQDNLFPPLYEA